jgi:transposase-like protein
MTEQMDKKIFEDFTTTKRWTASKKKAAVLRLFAGESLDDVSRELGITIAQLDNWKQKVLTQMEVLLKAREDDPLNKELDAAKKKIGELSMENELLREKAKKQGVFWGGR